MGQFSSFGPMILTAVDGMVLVVRILIMGRLLVESLA